MCGIAGLLSSTSRGDEEKILADMLLSLDHRGPDARGIWCDNLTPVILGHTRLSFLDLSPLGNQPMVSSNGRYVISFNGEIYNYRDLKIKLDLSRCALRGTSDTEILLELISQVGFGEALKQAKGMFAIALWDREKKELLLARDRFGEKPLYYWHKNEFFAFSSELRALLKIPKFNPDLDVEAVKKFFLYGNIPAPYSVFKGVSKLKPGHTLIVKINTTEVILQNSVPFWSADVIVNSDKAVSSLSFPDAKRELKKLLTKTIEDQLISDVPIGAFLSGGIDSSLIVSIVGQELGRRVSTFTVSFGESEYNEADIAKQIAQFNNTEHYECRLAASDLLDLVPKIPEIYDEPFADSSQLPTYLISRFAKKHVKACLSGDGGDEVFLGYNRYVAGTRIWSLIEDLSPLSKDLLVYLVKTLGPDAWNKIYNGLKKPSALDNLGEKLEKLGRALRAKDSHEYYNLLACHWLDESPLVSTDTLNSSVEKSEVNSNLPLAEQFMLRDINNYLPNDILTKVDRASMSVSLETRAPFLDHEVFEFAQSLPIDFKIAEGRGKFILRELLGDYLPAKIIHRPKKGFAVPLDQWFRGPLRDWVCNLLSDSQLNKSGILNSKVIQAKLNEHLSGDRNWQYYLWDVIIFQAWYSRWKIPANI